MKVPKLLTGGLLLGTVVAGAATMARVGVASANEPQGISIRQESASHNRGFFYGYMAGRSHRGGGLRGGK